MPRRRRSSTAPRAAATKGKTTGTAKKVRKNSRGSKKKAIEPKGQAETKKAKMSRKKTEAEKPKASLSKDWSSICLLLLLYTLQGVPMGISAAIPMLLEERKVSMTQQGVFSFCSWPFSLKLLWAPIVDATFNRAWGQRKSWLVPTQLLIGVVMFLSSYRIDSIMEGEADVDMTVLTAAFSIDAAVGADLKLPNCQPLLTSRRYEGKTPPRIVSNGVRPHPHGVEPRSARYRQVHAPESWRSRRTCKHRHG